jgi:hypothetical protein
LLTCYEENDKKKDKLIEVENKCKNEWDKISK